MNDIAEDEKRYKNDLGRENRSAIRCSIAMALLALAAIAGGALVALAQKPPANDTLTYVSTAASEPAKSSTPRPCHDKSCAPARRSKSTSADE